MFTSGTTGKPKGVISTHRQNLRVFEAWSEVVGLREGDRYLIVNPFFHAFGYKAGWLASIMRGATMLPHQVFDARGRARPDLEGEDLGLSRAAGPLPVDPRAPESRGPRHLVAAPRRDRRGGRSP